MELQQSAVNFKNFAFAAIFCLFVRWIWGRRRYYAFALSFPGKLGLPIFGNLFLIRHVLYDLEVLTKLFERGQQTVCVWMGLNPTIFTYEEKVIEKILNAPECFEKAMPFYEPVVYYSKDGLLSASGTRERFHRKKLNVIFKQQTLLSFYPIFNKFKNRMITDLEHCADGKEHILLNPILQNIGRSIMETLFDYPNIDEEQGIKAMDQLVIFLKLASRETIASSLNLHKIVRWLATKNPNYQYQLSASFLESIIEKKFREISLKNSDMHMEYGDLPDQRKYVTAIDVLYKMYKEQQFSREDVFGETLTLITASLETTSRTIYSVVALLAMHPSIQERLFEEITQVFREKDADVHYDHFKELPYLERVIQESLRLAPAGTLIARQNNKSLELPNGHIVPENMNIVISIYHLHRCKQIWGPNADKFDPDNFLPENIASRHPYAYIPFSKGPRICIGMSYGQQVVKVMLIGLIRNYRFETDFKLEDLKMKFHMTSEFSKDPGIRVYHRL